MKRLLAVAVAIAAVTMLSETTANAQGYAGGYQFGAGIHSAHGFGGARCGNFNGFNRLGLGRVSAFAFTQRTEDLPYFAKFPPVYYSNIVARPVGISPYAAPPGIAPVEMNHAPVKNVTIQNPYFDRKATPVKSVPLKKQLNNKMTSIVNPFMGSVANR